MPIEFNAASIREYIHQQKPKQEPVATPFWPEADGHICIQDVPTDELLNLTSANRDASGKLDMALYMASMLCMSLVVRETGEQVFPITDRDFVAKLGASLLTPVFKQVQHFFGIGEDAVEEAKKNFTTLLNGSSGTSLPPASAQP